MRLTKKIVFVILLLCLIINNGPDFSDNGKKRLFEPFRSAKPGKGAGLGLNIYYNPNKNHGGSITLNENYHEGAHFIITIPKGGSKNDGKTGTIVHR